MQEPPASGSFCDLLWSDPEYVDGFQESTRGAGYLFGESVVDKFNATKQSGDRLVGPQLLLPLRERGVDPVAGRVSQPDVPDLQGGRCRDRG